MTLLKHHDAEDKKTKALRIELNSKGQKLKWAKIDRVQHLKQHLVNMEDIQNFKEQEEMLQHHMIKYGTEKSIVPRKITEMESLPKPKKVDYKTIVINLNKIIANVKYITDNGEVERRESSVVKAIIEQAFHDELVHQHKAQNA